MAFLQRHSCLPTSPDFLDSPSQNSVGHAVRGRPGHPALPAEGTDPLCVACVPPNVPRRAQGALLTSTGRCLPFGRGPPFCFGFSQRPTQAPPEELALRSLCLQLACQRRPRAPATPISTQTALRVSSTSHGPGGPTHTDQDASPLTALPGGQSLRERAPRVPPPLAQTFPPARDPGPRRERNSLIC